ncbi:MAG: hypothetical protein E7353_05220 [Clostridiales bacterium]|nr:hypothetical protein [Clostridiales bacterium]
MDIEKIITKINNDDKAIATLSLSGEIDKEELIKQAELLKQMGMGGVVFHASAGLKSHYMSKDWCKDIQAIATILKEKGMRAYIADEDRRPGGMCGSIATMNPRYRAKSLTFEIVPKQKFSFSALSQNVVGVYSVKIVREDGIDKLSYYYKLNDSTSYKTDDDIMIVSIKENEASEFYNNGYYLDTLNSEAVQYFISKTHEKYKQDIGDSFGKEILGIYSTEPIRGPMFSPMFSGSDWQKCCPYTYDTEAVFEERWGYDLITRLPELFFFMEGEDYSIVTAHYSEVINNQFLNAYVIPYYEWCKNNNLILFANFAGEETLTSQAMLTGSCMSYYRYCDIPGVDVPYFTEEYWGMMKQVTSIKRQFNKQSCFSLNYGGTGWGATFAQYKNLADVQTYLGIDTRLIYKASSTLAQVAKRDYPTGVTTQSAFYDEYSYVENYFTRLSALNKATEESEHILVIHPGLSAWGKQVAGDCEGENRKDYRELENKFAQMYSFLIRNSIDFDYGDELIMAECAKVKGMGKNTTLKIGECKYKTIVVHGMETMRQSTFKLLTSFASRGGKVVFVGDLPKRLNGYKTNFALSELAKRATRSELNKELALLLAPKTFIRVDEYGSEKNVCFKKRIFADGSIFLYVINLNKEQAVDAMIKIEGDYKVEKIDVRLGVVEEMRVVRENGYTIISYLFEEGGELALSLTKLEKTKLFEAKEEKGREEKLFESITTDTLLDYKLSEPNVMVLDSAQYVVNGDGRGEFDVLQIDKFIRKEFNLFAREGIQPYFKKNVMGISSDAVVADVELRFRFAVRSKPSKLQIVLEEPERFVITVNDRRLSQTKVGDWIDKSFEKIALPSTYLNIGENVISLSFKLSDDTPIEPIYLIGDFGVKIIRNDTYEVNEIVELPQKLAIGDVTKQGLPYYGGKIYYYLPLEKGYYRFSFPSPRTFACVKIKSANKEKTVAFAPFTCEAKIAQAERDYARHDSSSTSDIYEMSEVDGAQIEVDLTRRNTFGPLHYKFKDENEFAEPYVFAPNDEDFSKRKVLQKSGLLALGVEKLPKHKEPEPKKKKWRVLKDENEETEQIEMQIPEKLPHNIITDIVHEEDLKS